MPAAKIATTPNILLLMVDQMRADAMGCAGNPYIKTPALDRLASEGVRFTRAYTPNPVCIPARHCMLTGHHCATHGRYANNVPDPEPLLETIPQLLGLAGYHTQAIGKMHFRPVRRHFGFNRMELMEEIPDFRQDDEYLLYLAANGYGHVRDVHGVRNLLYHLPQVSVLPEEHHGSTWVADRTIEFLRANRNRPFFCFSSWIAPHPPWNPPEPFASMYDPASLPLPVGWDRDPATLPPEHRQRIYADVCNASPAMLQRIKALYYGSISLVDKGVGRILDELDALGLADNTLVIFTSDHGEFLGDHHLFQKMSPYEASSRIPLLMRLPGRLAAGAVRDELVSLLDVMPTLLDLAEVPYPGAKPLPGASLLGREGGGLGIQRDRLVLEFGREAGRWVALREGDWRYTYYLNSGWEELYNLASDPHEQNNLLLAGDAAGDEVQSRARAMRRWLTQWEQEHGFASSLDSDGEFRRFSLPRQPRVYHNNQFPRWVDRLSPEEKAAMEPIGAGVVNAMRHETTYTLADLAASGSLQVWARQGGSLAGTEYAHLLPEEDSSHEKPA